MYYKYINDKFDSVSGTTFSFQVMPSTPESTQETRLVRVFCCLEFDLPEWRFRDNSLRR